MGYYFLIIVLSLLPLVSFFVTSDLPHTHDGLVHLPRMGAYYKALLDGQIPPRWAGDLNYGYGLPLFNFIYQLPYFLSSILIFLGLGLVGSFKIVLTASYILSGIFMFAFGKSFLNDDKKAFLVSVLYQFAPFRFVEILMRGSFGEVYTYAFLPLTLFGLIRLFKKPSTSNLILTALSSALLVLSHNSVSLLFFAVCIGFIIFFSGSKKNLIWGSSGLLWGILLSSFYWLPAIMEHKYTHGDLYMRDVYKSHFQPLLNFFIPNLTNDMSLQKEGIPVYIGLFQTIAFLLSVGVLIKKKDTLKKPLSFGLLLVFVSLFFTQPISDFFWKGISYLRQFQFPWRFLSVIVFATSFLGMVFFRLSILKKTEAFYALISLIILSSVLFWKPSLGYDKIEESKYWNFPLNTTYYGETDVIWSAGPAKEYPAQRVELIGGRARISNFYKKSNLHSFTVLAENRSQILDHTQYFPGWKVYVNNSQVPIEFQDINHRGEITFYVPKGKNDIRVVFGENKTRLIADIVSLSAFVPIIIILLYKFRTLSS